METPPYPSLSEEYIDSVPSPTDQAMYSWIHTINHYERNFISSQQPICILETFNQMGMTELKGIVHLILFELSRDDWLGYVGYWHSPDQTQPRPKFQEAKLQNEPRYNSLLGLSS